MDEEIQENTTNSFFVPGYNDANKYSQDALRSILVATKSANALPSAGDDFDYYSTFPGFREVMFRKRQAILSLMTSLVSSHGIREKFQGRESEEKFDLLVEANDVILENVSTYLDEASGIKKSEQELVLAVKPPSAINTSWNKKQFKSATPESYKLLTAKNISRPQLTFKDKIDNSNSIFVPIIKEKPNSIKPLAIMRENDGENDEFCHPYEWEIEKFSPQEEHLQPVEAVFPKPLEETPLIIVKTEKQLQDLCSDLMKEKEFAVDLEHHAYRSFQGFTCLMQISTREKDYIIDVLELRSQLYILNEVFTNPKIVKVLHGADMDVLWLQRDFGIYIVNLFDTGQAARVLQFAHLSLSYLLKYYCKLDVDKHFQLADWRIRPIPEEMIKYAREDTHYLLYVYDCLKNDLLKNGNDMQNLLYSTFERSKVICAKRYQKPLFNDEKYLELYKKSKKVLNAKQMYCLREVYAWRDRIARECDESYAYVLPNHMLLAISDALPREQQGILACCNPIPPLVKQQLSELHSIILKANETSIKQLEILKLQQTAQATKIIRNQIDLSSLVHCPHDIHHLEDGKSHNLNQSGCSENLLPLITTEESSTATLNKKPILSALFRKVPSKISSHDPISKQTIEKVVGLIKKLISPYERYKVTEQLQPSQKETEKTKANENGQPQEDTEVQIESVEDESGPVEAVIKGEPGPIKVGNSSQDSKMPEDSEDCNLTSLRKKSNKRKKKMPDPDISFSSKTPPPKKVCTPEVVTIDDDNFTPYDYNQSDYDKFSGQNSQKKSKKEKSRDQTSKGGYFGKKRKNVKQATFSEKSNNRPGGAGAKWPQNKS